MPRTKRVLRRWSTKARYAAAALGLSLAVAACDNELAPNETKISLAIGPARVPCQGFVPQECFRVQFLPEATWKLFYDPIMGFDYEPGYNYRVEVAQRDVPDPPLDGSSVVYRLIKITSKERTIIK